MRFIKRAQGLGFTLVPMPPREARLKPEYAAEYPGLSPGVWTSATDLAKVLIQRARAGRQAGRYTRTLDPNISSSAEVILVCDRESPAREARTLKRSQRENA